MQEFLIKNEEEMAIFAKNLALHLAPKKPTIGLLGTLGAGKSFFAKSFINSLQKNPSEILSPTFNLVLSHETRFGEVAHFDLYRLKNKDELENIGFFDNIKNGICLIEWPQIANDFLKKLPNYYEIEIKIIDENQRKIILSQPSSL